MTPEHYEACRKYSNHEMLPLGTRFTYKAGELTIIGATQAGNQYRCAGEDGKVFRFDIKNFEKKYGIRLSPNV